MIGFVKGKVIFKGSNYLILNTGNVGFKVFVKEDLFSKDELSLFIYHQVREDQSDLFGFEEGEDLKIFEMLISVSGVGPKVAMVLMSKLGREKIICAIKDADLTLFKSISGVGSKVAGKIIVELKNKVSGEALSDNFLKEDNETVEALIALGLKKNEILPILKEIPHELITTQEKIKFVLKNARNK